MGVPFLHASGPDPDQGRIPAAAEDLGARCKAQLVGRLFCQIPGNVGGFNYSRKVVPFDSEHVDDGPGPVAGLRVVEEGGEGRVLGHHAFAGAAGDDGFLDVQPLVRPRKRLGLVFLHPLIFPYRVLDGDRGGTRVFEALQELDDIAAGDFEAAPHVLLNLGLSPLVHVGHGVPDGDSLFVDQDQALHLGTEGNSGDLGRVDERAFEDVLGRNLHGLPPLVEVLLDPAVADLIEAVAEIRRGRLMNLPVQFKQAGLDAGGPDVVGKNIGHL